MKIATCVVRPGKVAHTPDKVYREGSEFPLQLSLATPLKLSGVIDITSVRDRADGTGEARITTAGTRSMMAADW